MFCPQRRILFFASLVSYSFCIIRTPCPVKVWSPGHFFSCKVHTKCATLLTHIHFLSLPRRCGHVGLCSSRRTMPIHEHSHILYPKSKMNSMGACAPTMYRTGESLFKSMGAWEPTIYRSPSLKVWVPGNLIDVQTGRSSPSLKVWVPGHPRHSVKGVVGNPYLKTVGVWAPRMSGLWVFWWCTAKVKITD